MKVVYFSWVRERIGIAEETADLPGGVDTVAGLMDWLAARGEGYALAFQDRGVIRAAVDQELAFPDTSLAGVGEVAFFPPMTGG